MLKPQAFQQNFRFMQASMLTCYLLLPIRTVLTPGDDCFKVECDVLDLCRTRMEKEDLNPDNMIKPEDVCELVLLPFRVSPNAVPQEIVLDAMKNPSA